MSKKSAAVGTGAIALRLLVAIAVRLVEWMAKKWQPIQLQAPSTDDLARSDDCKGP